MKVFYLLTIFDVNCCLQSVYMLRFCDVFSSAGGSGCSLCEVLIMWSKKIRTTVIYLSLKGMAISGSSVEWKGSLKTTQHESEFDQLVISWLSCGITSKIKVPQTFFTANMALVTKFKAIALRFPYGFFLFFFFFLCFSTSSWFFWALSSSGSDSLSCHVQWVFTRCFSSGSSSTLPL